MESREELARFKHLTEYFVAHLEYLANGSQPTSIGYQEYIMPWIEEKSFKSSGQGWNGQGIQKQVSEWDYYGNGQICINVYGANFKSRGTYLNWKGTGANIMVEWNGTHVNSLILVDYDPDLEEWHPKGIEYPLNELNMFDGLLPNEKYKSLFDEYNKMMEAINNNKRIQALDKYIQLLKTNKNLILTGAPGTGKTFMAKAIAEELGAETGFVQFHPSYDYTDFVEGLRPQSGDTSNVGFERMDGVFKKFCSRALQNQTHNYIFIIDEINRGEISKIFGELFFSIDPGYRGEAGKVQTQYQNMIEDDDAFKDGFYVPENVYIIGTMNDIDRSVESMDFAMRRRFAWQEVTAEESFANMIENDAQFAPVKDEIKARMFNLNKAIAATEGLDEAYHIGAAYFRKYLDYQDRENPFECLWENHLKGLLFEYLRGNRRAKELLEKLHEAYNKTSIDEQPAHTNEGQL